GSTPSPVTAAARGNGSSAASAASDADASRRSLLRLGIQGRGPRSRWLIPVFALVALAVVAVVLVLALGSGSADHKAADQRRQVANIAAAPPGVVPSTITFAVVNATNINQLAHHVGDQLTARGFKEA